MTRVGDVVGLNEGRAQLLERGMSADTVDQLLAFRTWMARASDPTSEPTEPDEQFARTWDARAYLAAVAPELLDA